VARRKKTILDPYIKMQGHDPVDVLRGLMNFHLDKGNLEAAGKYAAELAPYKRPRFSAVAVGQVELFPDGSAALLPPGQKPRDSMLTIRWDDGPSHSLLSDGSAREGSDE
jgi:hypothetical protein